MFWVLKRTPKTYVKTEVSSKMRALQRAIVSVIIALLNNSERSLNKKMAAPSNKQIKFPHWLEINAKHLPTFLPSI